jgi:hypothetical protein
MPHCKTTVRLSKYDGGVWKAGLGDARDAEAAGWVRDAARSGVAAANDSLEQLATLKTTLLATSRRRAPRSHR